MEQSNAHRKGRCFTAPTHAQHLHRVRAERDAVLGCRATAVVLPDTRSYCAGIAMVLRWYLAGTVLVLDLYRTGAMYTGTVLVLCWRCGGMLLELHKYRIGSTLVLRPYRIGSNTVLVQRQYSASPQWAQCLYNTSAMRTQDKCDAPATPRFVQILAPSADFGKTTPRSPARAAPKRPPDPPPIDPPRPRS